jgi:hypothetical protein
MVNKMGGKGGIKPVFKIEQNSIGRSLYIQSPGIKGKLLVGRRNITPEIGQINIVSQSSADFEIIILRLSINSFGRYNNRDRQQQIYNTSHNKFAWGAVRGLSYLHDSILYIR